MTENQKNHEKIDFSKNPKSLRILWGLMLPTRGPPGAPRAPRGAPGEEKQEKIENTIF